MLPKALTGIALCSCIFCGCDKESDSNGPSTQPAAVVLPAGPTTQQLLNGPRTRLDLKYAPFSLQVPPGWKIDSFQDGATVVLEGPTPTDNVSISIPVQRTITAEQKKLLEAEAEKDLAQYPDYLKSPVVRDLPGTRVIEHFVIDPAMGSTIQSVQWTFTLCLPNGKDFTAYELRLVGMTVPQYKADQAFLRTVLSSLSYTAPTTEPDAK